MQPLLGSIRPVLVMADLPQVLESDLQSLIGHIREEQLSGGRRRGVPADVRAQLSMALAALFPRPRDSDPFRLRKPIFGAIQNRSLP
jgi:hypothetical protein